MSLLLWHFPRYMSTTLTRLSGELITNISVSRGIKWFLSLLLLWGEEIQKSDLGHSLSYPRHKSCNARPPSHLVAFVHSKKCPYFHWSRVMQFTHNAKKHLKIVVCVNTFRLTKCTIKWYIGFIFAKFWKANFYSFVHTT